MKGGDATFQCVAEGNSMVLLFGWDFIHQGGMLTTVITGTPVTGVSMVMVSGDRMQLSLSGVQREVDGVTVVYSAFGSTVVINSNRATINIHCKYGNHHDNIWC